MRNTLFYNLSTKKKKIISCVTFSATALSVGLLGLASTSFAAPFYGEAFFFDITAKNTFDGQEKTGWVAIKGGSKLHVVGNLKVSPGNPPLPNTLIPQSYNAAPQGPDYGYAFWSKPVQNLTVFTTEYSFDISRLKEAIYSQKLSGAGDQTRFALRVRSPAGAELWYISDQQNPQCGINDFTLPRFNSACPVSGRDPIGTAFNPSTLTYSVVKAKTTDTGPELSAASASGVALPTSGIVTAFGVYLDTVTGKVRIDNYVLRDNFATNDVVPDAKPAHSNELSPQNGDVDESPDQSGFIPATPPTQVTYGLCSNSTKTSKRLVASARTKLRILAALSKSSSVKNLRNRVVVELLTNNIAPSSLENVLVSDYFKARGRTYLNVYGRDKKSLRLSTAQSRDVAKYIAAAKLTVATSPLFRDLSGNTVTTAALCRSTESRILSNVIKKAGVQGSVSYR